jgi:hypothetical protein
MDHAVSGTPILDAAVRAGCNKGCNYPDCEPACHPHALRMERILHEAVPWSTSGTFMIARYTRLMRELYPEKFR